METKTPEYWQRQRRKSIVTEGKIRSVACPKCGAPPGMDCHSARWNRVGFHVDRKHLVGQ